MERRNFLTSLAVGVVAIITTPITLRSSRYVLHGDGIHDDTEALQAWVDGKEVFWSNGEPVGTRISDKRFIVSHNGIYFHGDADREMTFCYIEGRNLSQPPILIHASAEQRVAFTRNCLNPYGSI